jgi:aspartyl protease family protein
MRILLLFVSVVVFVAVLTAHLADRALNHVITQPRPAGSETMTAESHGRNLASMPASNSYPNPSSIVTQPVARNPPKPPLPQVVTLTRTVTLRDDGNGHFRAAARIDGVRVDFMIDTGASMVTLRQSTAAKLGFYPMDREFTVPTQTANGVGRAAQVRISSVELDTIVVRDVQAFILPDNLLSMNLLGMTFLSRLRWTHDRGKLVIEQ